MKWKALCIRSQSVVWCVSKIVFIDVSELSVQFVCRKLRLFFFGTQYEIAARSHSIAQKTKHTQSQYSLNFNRFPFVTRASDWKLASILLGVCELWIFFSVRFSVFSKIVYSNFIHTIHAIRLFYYDFSFAVHCGGRAKLNETKIIEEICREERKKQHTQRLSTTIRKNMLTVSLFFCLLLACFFAFLLCSRECCCCCC